MSGAQRAAALLRHACRLQLRLPVEAPAWAGALTRALDTCARVEATGSGATGRWGLAAYEPAGPARRFSFLASGGGDGASSSDSDSDSDSDGESPSGWKEGRVSPRLAALLQEVSQVDEAQLLDDIATALNRADGQQAAGASPSSEADSEEDYLRLADAIDLYTARRSPGADDGLGDQGRAMLAALGALLREVTGTQESRVLNLAAPGQLPWEVIDVDEEMGVVHWAADLTQGRAPDPWRNARLSEASKQAMADMHASDPAKYDVPALASLFRVRQQRVSAILALKALEAEAAAGAAQAAQAAAAAAPPPPPPSAPPAFAQPAAAGPESEQGAGAGGQERPSEAQEKSSGGEAQGFGPAQAEELAALMEEVWVAHEDVGSGERHVVVLPSYPAYQELDAAAVISRLEAKLGKKASEIDPDADLTPELARAVLGVQGATADLEAQLAEREEAALVADFDRRLAYNLRRAGASLSRASRRTHAVPRPQEGWSLLVRPLGGKPSAAAGAGGGADSGAYVARPDGSRRRLTADEQFNLERQTPRPRRKVL